MQQTTRILRKYFRDGQLSGRLEPAVGCGDNAYGTRCTHCGAPIRRLGNMICEYCGSGVTPINIKVWSLHKFYEVDYNHI